LNPSRARGLVLAACAIVWLAPPPARAENQAPPSPTELVHFEEPHTVKLAPGQSVRVRLEFKIREHWHVNAHRPHEDFLVPTTLTLKPVAAVRPGAPRYPDPTEAKLSFSETPLAVYERKFEIEVPMTAARDAAKGKYAIAGTLRFQSCNDQVCLPPATIPVSFDVQVEGDPVPAVAQTAVPAKIPGTTHGELGVPREHTSATLAESVDVEPAPVAGSSNPTDGPTQGPKAGASGGASGATAGGGDDLVGRWFAERGSFLAFVLIFLMGLALNLTPCVYPMMGVTISLFGGGVGTSSAGLRALPKAIVYVLGIALMYSTLGVIAALTGGLFGGWLSNPWVLGAIGLLLFAMALSMFGVYELAAPSGLLSRLGGMAGGGFLGTFLAGLLVGVFAAPCIGPPIIALLAHVGARGDPVFGFWAFFVLSLGLGLPYLVLGVSSGLLIRLPRSGSWMDWVKHLFGVILLGVAAFYLCLAIAPSKLAWVVPAALGLGGLYLGFLEPTGRDRPTFRRFKWAVGVAGIVAAAMVAFRAAPPAITWEPYAESMVIQARNEGRAVVLDFSADWCVPCHELDQNTFTDRRVAEALAPFRRYKVDLTRSDAPETIVLRERYRITGVPTILFLGADGREVAEARVVGFLAPEPFLERVRVARGAAAVASGR
jgi:thiol:disulfide interchange protein DsbD